MYNTYQKTAIPLSHAQEENSMRTLIVAAMLAASCSSLAFAGNDSDGASKLIGRTITFTGPSAPATTTYRRNGTYVSHQWYVTASGVREWRTYVGTYTVQGDMICHHITLHRPDERGTTRYADRCSRVSGNTITTLDTRSVSVFF